MVHHAQLKALSCLKEIAHLYRGFLVEFNGLSRTTSGKPIVANNLNCFHELLHREKSVAVVQGAALRAHTASASSRSAGVPPDVGTWTSGELVHKILASPTSSSASSVAPTFRKFLEDRATPLKVFELSSIARPRKWSELMSRAPPPLTDLAKAKVISRVGNIEDADVCYWDLHEGDDLGTLLEASLELCHEFRVPLLQVRTGESALQALKFATPRGSPEAAALSLERLGGKSLSVGKLDGSFEALGWADKFDKREVLLLTSDLADVAEANAHGIDSVLLVGERVTSQLRAFAAAEQEAKAADRRHASMSQRVAEDSPAMFHAASNPFFSVFKLPSLLAEATRRNHEHRQRKTQAVVADTADSSTITSSSQGRPLDDTLEDTLEILKRWCAAAHVQLPVATCSGTLPWDDTNAGDHRTLNTNEVHTVTARPCSGIHESTLLGNSQQASGSTGENTSSWPSSRRGRRPQGSAAQATPKTALVENESVADILNKLGRLGGQ